MKFTRFLLLLALPLYFISCKPLQKIPNYLENVNDSTGKGVVKVVELKIQKNDLLSIQIFSLSTRQIRPISSSTSPPWVRPAELPDTWSIITGILNTTAWGLFMQKA